MLLLHYSIADSINSIHEDRRSMEETDSDEHRLEIFDKEFEIDKNLLNSILDVIEMVIPY